MRSLAGMFIGHHLFMRGAGSASTHPGIRDIRVVPIAYMSVVVPLLVSWYMSAGPVLTLAVTVIGFVGVMTLAALRMPAWQGSESEKRSAVVKSVVMLTALFAIAAAIRLVL